MQSNPVKKKKAANLQIKKPFLRGKPFSGLAIKRGLRILTYLLLSTILYFFLGQLMVIDVPWLRILVNLVVLVAFAGLMYSNGAREGEGDVSYAEIAYARKQEGKTVSREDLNRCFHPAKGFATALAGTLPLMLLCLVYALMAVKDTYSLGALPSWVSAYLKKPDISLALSYYHDYAGIGAADILRLVVRLLVFPFVNMVGSRNADALLFVERLSPILVLIVPMFYGVGYLRGESYRSRVHGGIAANAKRTAQKQRKKKKVAARKQEPKQLV
ncbi:MAG: hypothetical protein GXZ04_07290 [Clostridiales bacterium]|nr:hypothetical protein [Clostridiales bacterium]